MRQAMIYSMAIVAMLGGAGIALAEAVDGTWTNADGFGDGPIHFPDTNSPIVGENPNDPNFGFNDAEQEMIFSPFTTITLANPGDKLTFTGSVELRGTVNSPLSGTGSGNPRTQFRFGLFQANADPEEEGWVGYFMHNKHGAAGSPQGVLALKPVGNTSVFLSTTGQTTIQAQPGDGTEASRFNDGTYNLMMTIERNSAGELVLNSSIIGVGDRPPVEPYDPLSPPPSPGPNVFSQIMSGTTNPIDTDPALPNTAGTYAFDRLGFLMGGNLDADHAAYMNLDVTFTPGGAAGLTGDYNNDGSVDAADYVAWRKGQIANDNDPPGAGPEDYAAWVENFGATSPGSGGGSAVPEPAVPALIAIVGLFAACRRKRYSNN
jgi:hypothetical protein